MYVKITNTFNNQIILSEANYANVSLDLNGYDKILSVGDINDTTTILNFVNYANTSNIISISLGQGYFELVGKIDSCKFDTEVQKVYLTFNQAE